MGGVGEVDKYDYEGYRRNRQYFLVRDYTDIYVGSLQNILKGKNVILVGNLNLCYNVERVLKEAKSCNVSYWDILEENSEKEIRMMLKNDKNIREGDICFLIEPRYLCGDSDHQRQLTEKKRLYLEKLKENKVVDITEYFSDREVFISIQSKDAEKYTLSCVTPSKILLNISGHMSGNDLFQFIIDGHPNILIIDDEVVRSNLFFICMQLAEEQAENILSTFWKICDTIYLGETILCKKEMLNKLFEEFFTYKAVFTSQELFVMFYIAYAKICGREISDVRNMLIYYEDRVEASHNKRINYEEWLCDEKIRGFSINIIRNHM